MTQNSFRAALAATFAMGIAAPVWAQPASSQNDPEVPDIIVTALGVAMDRNQNGQAVSILPKTLLEDRQSVAVADVLATLPGVTLSRNGPLGGFSALRIRGAEGEQTLALIDGIKVNDPASPGGGFDFGTLLSGNIARIEVLRGPNSVPWGSQALGGVVNILTEQPGKGLTSNVRAEQGTADTSHLVANLAAGNETVRGSFGGGLFSGKGISAFKNGIERDGLRQRAANGRIEFDVAPQVRLDLRGWYAHSRADQDGFPPPFYSFADTEEQMVSEQSLGYVGIEAQTGIISHRFSATLSDINRVSFAKPGDPVPQYLNKGRIERIEYRGDLRWNPNTRMVMGVDQEWSSAYDGIDTQKTRQTSGYVQVLLEPVSNISVTAGARLDDHQSFGTHSSFSANLVWQPSDGTILRAAYGEGFKAPTLFQLFSFYGNTMLRPETAKSYEMGLEQALWGERLRFSVTGFLRNTRDQVNYVLCFGQTTGVCKNRPNGTYDNIDATRAKGIETSLGLRMTERLDLTINYTLLNAIDRETGKDLIRRPKHSLFADLAWQIPFGPSLAASFRLASSSSDTDFESYQPTSLDGYRLVGLRGSWPVSKGLEFFARVDNLFDAAHETVSGYGSYGRTSHLGLRANF